jgi:hypothetical protein
MASYLQLQCLGEMLKVEFAAKAARLAERFETNKKNSITEMEEMTMSTTTLIIIIVLCVILFGGGGGYYWSRRR